MSEEKKTLTGDQVIDVIKDLVKQQGFYSRLLNTIEDWEVNNVEFYEAFKKGVEELQFKDEVDVVMFFES